MRLTESMTRDCRVRRKVVWEHVCADRRFFITLDLDFSDVRRYQPGTHPGILLIRPRNRSASAVAKVLARVIAEQPLDTLRGCFQWRMSLHENRRPTRPAPADVWRG
jgi:predicted nuclease of predicted toxin-antitoxin system